MSNKKLRRLNRKVMIIKDNKISRIKSWLSWKMKLKSSILSCKESRTISLTRSANIVPHQSRISSALTSRTQQEVVVQVLKISRKKLLKIKDIISLRVSLTRLRLR